MCHVLVLGTNSGGFGENFRERKLLQKAEELKNLQKFFACEGNPPYDSSFSLLDLTSTSQVFMQFEGKIQNFRIAKDSNKVTSSLHVHVDATMSAAIPYNKHMHLCQKENSALVRNFQINKEQWPNETEGSIHFPPMHPPSN